MIRVCFLSCSLLFFIFGFSNQVQAKSCVISDPTDRALNVRETPNGRIINRLKNGRTVEIVQFQNDAKGRPWGYATGYYEGDFRNWGWVFMAAVAERVVMYVAGLPIPNFGYFAAFAIMTALFYPVAVLLTQNILGIRRGVVDRGIGAR